MFGGVARNENITLNQAASLLGKKGGKARAAKYDAETLSKWAKRGGRPRKPLSKLSQQGKWARIRREKQRRERERQTRSQRG
jgi:hypothetical protein